MEKLDFNGIFYLFFGYTMYNLYLKSDMYFL